MEPALLLALDLAPLLPKMEVTQSALHGVLGPAYHQTTLHTLLLHLSYVQSLPAVFMLDMSCEFSTVYTQLVKQSSATLCTMHGMVQSK